jgi:PAS domain S-box-containing protein
VIDSLPCIFFLLDEEGNKLRWNKNFETVTGYSSEEIKQMHPLDFFDEKDHERVNHAIEQVFTAGASDLLKQK